jgi:capsular polysaccharide transport system permease protein
MTRIENNREFADFVTLVTVRSSVTASGGNVSWWSARARWLRSHLLLLFMLVIPGLLGAVYYAFICAEQYVSETQFVVRSPNRNAAGLLSGFLQSTGFVRAQDDSYIVSEFMMSRAAVDELAAKNDLKDIMSRPEADFLNRYPLPWTVANNEELFQHYKNFVKVDTNSSSGVTTLEVYAFRAEDSFNLANALLQHAEELINQLNDRARGDAIRYAQVELTDSEGRLQSTQKNLTDFRNRETLIDPSKLSI